MMTYSVHREIGFSRIALLKITATDIDPERARRIIRSMMEDCIVVCSTYNKKTYIDVTYKTKNRELNLIKKEAAEIVNEFQERYSR